MSKFTYLDYMSTTPVDQEVIHVMNNYMGADGCFANPSSKTHQAGIDAFAAVQLAREQVAHCINASPREIIWTSGATESNNMALLGAARFYARSGKHIISIKTEHAAVLGPLQALQSEGFRVTLLDVDRFGRIDINDMRKAIRDDTILISTMHVNNETGVINDIQAIGEIAKTNGVKYHIDAAQSLGKITLDLDSTPADLVSLSAHKNYGPKGIGALYVKQNPRTRLTPITYGGQQEWGIRPGTLATPQIVGMGKSCEIAHRDFAKHNNHIKACAKILSDSLLSMEAVTLNGHAELRYPGCINLHIKDVDAKHLIDSLPEIAMSQGSACSNNSTPSHVLKSMGLNQQQISNSVRLSVGRHSNLAQMHITADAIKQSIELLRTNK